MTDRVNQLTVVLDHEMRVDDVEELVAAIRMLRHVLTVKLGSTDNDFSARVQERALVRAKLYAMIKDLPL